MSQKYAYRYGDRLVFIKKIPTNICDHEACVWNRKMQHNGRYYRLWSEKLNSTLTANLNCHRITNRKHFARRSGSADQKEQILLWNWDMNIPVMDHESGRPGSQGSMFFLPIISKMWYTIISGAIKCEEWECQE